MAEDERQLLEQFQTLQQQLQTILIQKENIKLQQLETEKALDELMKSDAKEAYKIAGPIMIRKSSDEIKKDLEERVGDLDLRMKTMEKTEERIVNKLKEMEPKLKKLMGQ